MVRSLPYHEKKAHANYTNFMFKLQIYIDAVMLLPFNANTNQIKSMIHTIDREKEALDQLQLITKYLCYYGGHRSHHITLVLRNQIKYSQGSENRSIQEFMQ